MTPKPPPTTGPFKFPSVDMPDWVPDLAGMDRDELDVLAKGVEVECARRDAAEKAEARMERAAEEVRIEYRAAVDEQPADGHPAWVQPTGAHNAYPLGWRVDHPLDGATWTWRNLRPGNPDEPGVSGWRIEPPEGEVAPYVRVSGAHDAYHRSDRVRAKHDDNVYFCDADVCAHAPSNSASGWVKEEEPAEPELPEEPTDPPTEEPTDPEPEPTDPEPEPEEPTEPAPAPWAEGEVYGVDDLVTWEGATYRCLQAHTAIAGWTPPAVPALWEVAA